MRVLLITMHIGLFLVWALPAQVSDAGSEAARVDEILEGGAITAAQAAWLVGRATGVLAESASPEEALEVAASRWGLTRTAPDAPVAADAFARLLMGAEAIPGGLFYTLFPGPRYAFRQLVYLRIFPPGLQPDAQLSGAYAMLYLQNTQSWKEAHP